MSVCINTKLDSFKALVEISGLSPLELEVKMGVWMNKNNTHKWPHLNQIGINVDKSILKSNIYLDIYKSEDNITLNPSRINFIHKNIGLNSTTASNIINSIKGVSKKYDNLFRLINNKFLSDVKVKISTVENKTDKLTQAQYDLKEKTVTLFISNKSLQDDIELVKVIAHELIHAFTVAKWRYLSEKIKTHKATVDEIKIYDDIKSAESIAKEHLSHKFESLFNLKGDELTEEFIAATFEEEFIKEANNIKVKNDKTLFDKIIDFIKNILGVNKNTLAEYAISSAITLAKSNISENTTDVDRINYRKTDSSEFSESTKRIIDSSKDFELTEIENEDGTKEQGEQYVDQFGNTYNRVTYGSLSLKDAFFPYEFSTSKDWIKSKADSIWGIHDHDKRLMIDGKSYNYDEYLEHKKSVAKIGTTKGNIIHLSDEYVNAKDDDKHEIKRKIEEFEDNAGIERGRYNWFIENAKEIYDTLGINKFKKNIPEDTRDKVAKEIIVSSKLLGYAGSVDTMVEHQEEIVDYFGKPVGKYLSLYDLKSSGSINNLIGKSILKFGEQNRVITSSPMDLAKLQIALYAIIIKLENPNQRFRRLQVVSVKDKYSATHFDPNSIVEPESFIPMIESFFKDKKSLEKLGLPLDIHDKMIEVSPDIFNQYHYSSTKMTEPASVSSEKRNHRITVLEQTLKDPSIKYNYDEVKLIKEQLRKLSEERAREEGDYETIFEDPKRSTETPWLTKWLGGIRDSNNPFVKTFVRSYESAKHRYEKITLSKATRIGAAIDELMNEWKSSRNIGKLIEDDHIDMYTSLLKTDFIENVGEVERLILPIDKEFSSLSKTQQNFILLHEELMSEFFKDKDSYFNTPAFFNVNNKPISHLELQNSSFRYYPGFFPKISPSNVDLKRMFGDGDSLKGQFSWKYIQSKRNRALSYFEESSFDEYDETKMGIPIKYLGNKDFDANRYYSHDIGLALSKFQDWAEWKKEMDSVYAIGRSAMYQLDDLVEISKRDDNIEDASMYKRESDILQGFLRKKIKGIAKDEITWLGRNSKIKLGEHPATKKPIYFVPQKFLIGLSKWARTNSLWGKPFGAAGNLVQQQWLLKRNGLNYTWAKKFVGIPDDQQDYSYGDALFGDVVFSSIAKDALTNNLNNNKFWRLMERYSYIDGNMIKAIDRRVKTFRQRTTVEEAMLSMHSMGELWAAVTTFSAQMNHMKLKDGRSMHEAYSLVDGEIVWDGSIRGKIKNADGTFRDLGELDSNEVSRLKRVHEKLMGGYRDDEFCGMELYAVGQFFLALKKYFPRIVMNLLGEKKTDIYLGQYEKIGEYNIDGNVEDILAWRGRDVEGKLKSVLTFLSMVWSAKGLNTEEFKSRWANMNFEQKRNIIEAAHTVIELALLGALYSALFGGMPDDDQMKKWYKMYLLDNLAQQYNPVDISRTLSNITPVGAARAYKSMNAFATMTFAEFDNISGDYEGSHTQKGDLKGLVEFRKSIPFLSSYYDFESKVSKMSIINSEDNQSKNFFDGFFDIGNDPGRSR